MDFPPRNDRLEFGSRCVTLFHTRGQSFPIGVEKRSEALDLVNCSVGEVKSGGSREGAFELINTPVVRYRDFTLTTWSSSEIPVTNGTCCKPDAEAQISRQYAGFSCP